ncbi:AraC family transcriptional regulator [Seonamhaeicola marinus]|uniref:AraC family transcriptional regulator n=1 Tax=Seonamhaeicola marinus TaxID=1912246 RepID=A0A5D0HTG9_9FLAO|nr:AraC family transcriptional regulator [Seonamhaeicola marinus]TYA74605.1 AraC family transcriptional regulator [Seonamhaeicola marinus]
MPSNTKNIVLEHIKRINNVLDFIEKNLDSHLSLEILAQKAHYSPFHFHRLFSTITNENLTEYINRKRLERVAAILLVDSKITMKTLSYTYGFNSENTFSRAFKKYYGITPTNFKSEGKSKLSKIGIAPFNTEKYICDINNLRHWTKMNAQIAVTQIEDLKLAAITGIGNFNEITSKFQKLFEWGHRNKILAHEDFKTITIYHDNPHVTDLSKVRYSACVTIRENFKAEGDIRPLTISEGDYAIGHFEIDSKEFSKAWKSMSNWVMENGYQFRDADYFETYLNDYKDHPEQKHIINIFIPIEKDHKSKQKSENSYCTKLTPQKQTQYDYFELISFMKEIRYFFEKNHGLDFKLGNIYKGNRDFSYFSLTTSYFKKQKLKFVLIFNHKNLNFRICLSGQNKGVRKKYWNLFNGSDWNKYALASSIDDSLSIIDYTIVKTPNFNQMDILKSKIETETFKFINEFRDILEK